tara:strand:- start:9026 stop:9136 length:111 start_codon:yes stop_codon:yes gene_type:complete
VRIVGIGLEELGIGMENSVHTVESHTLAKGMMKLIR